MASTTPAPPLPLIRAGLAAGVLMFGGVVWFMHRQPTWTGPRPLLPAFGYAQVAMSAIAVLVAFVLRGRVATEADPQRRASSLILGWAICEGAALLGAVIFFLTDKTQWYFLGLLAMLASFAILPIDKTR